VTIEGFPDYDRSQSAVQMKRDNPAKHFIFAFVIALLGYLLVYHFIENRRTRKGPWQVTFTNNATGTPAIVINQPALGISNVEIQFPSGTITNAQSPISNLQSQSTNHLFFNQPKAVPYDVPFGKCVFMDTTFQPGTVTFQLFNHEIELLPRTLVLDRQEHAWQAGEIIALTAPPPTNTTAHPSAK
jgi:hypothetical protein